MVNQLNVSAVIFTDDSTFTPAGMFNKKKINSFGQEKTRICFRQLKFKEEGLYLQVESALHNNKAISIRIFLNGNLKEQKYYDLSQNEIEEHLE